MSFTKSCSNSSACARPHPRRGASPACRLTRVAGRHHDDHRLGLLRRDEVVQDESRASDRGPRVVGVAGTVEQIEDGELAAAQFVARRRVDMHAANLLQRRRIVGDGRDRAVGHIPGIHEVGPGHVHEAPDVVVRLADRRAARIDHRHAVHVEVVAVRTRLQRPDGDLPHAVVGLRHRHALAVVRDVGARQPDLVCSRREDPEDDAPVGQDLG